MDEADDRHVIAVKRPINRQKRKGLIRKRSSVQAEPGGIEFFGNQRCRSATEATALSRSV
jgi:hypothetical protein